MADIQKVECHHQVVALLEDFSPIDSFFAAISSSKRRTEVRCACASTAVLFVYSRNKDPAGVDGDVRGFPDVELDDCLFDELTGDTEVRSVVPGPTPVGILGDVRIP